MTNILQHDTIYLPLILNEANMNEARSNRFKRLATQRTNAVLDKLRLLGNLSNKSNYEYTEEEIRKIFSAIDDDLKRIKTKFNSTHKQKFTL